jgi:hypothetical protein
MLFSTTKTNPKSRNVYIKNKPETDQPDKTDALPAVSEIRRSRTNHPSL